jgi:pyrimidine-nucleoside phosphorylase
MRAVDLIRKKRDGLALDAPEIDVFVSAAAFGAWPDYQLAAMLMAIRLRGMTPEETACLTRAMVRSGVRLDWPGLTGAKADKHSTGGVGDKTSLVIVPLVAACGVAVPMISGRGLSHTGGTLDKLESIPGFRVALTLHEFREAVAQVGCAMIGQTAEIAPADKKLYALRDVTATVDSIPLISASIMSKKMAEGIDALVLDVKCGRGAFMKTQSEARTLAESLVAIGRANGVKTEAILTSMDAPLGRAVGNSLEVIEALETLKGRGPSDLEALSISLAARMLRLSGAAASDNEAEKMIRNALASGRALEKFRQMIKRQGGDGRVVDDYARLPVAPFRAHFNADRAGFVSGLDAERIGRAAMALGAGRERAEDLIDPAVGVVVLTKPGDCAKAGDPILELHYRDASRLDAALAVLRNACRVENEALPSKALILETVV